MVRRVRGGKSLKRDCHRRRTMSKILSAEDIRITRETEVDCQYDAGRQRGPGNARAFILWGGLLSILDSHEALRAEVERLERANRHHQVALQVAARELKAKVPRDSALYDIIRLAEKDALIALDADDAKEKDDE